MMRYYSAVAALLWATSAQAADTEDCLPGLICASDPATVVRAVQEAGYKAKLGKDRAGDPKIDTSGGGYEYAILFYGCEAGKACSSLQFSVGFKSEGYETPALANKWNETKRLLKASVDDKGSMQFTYDLSTVGGVNQKQFGDTIDFVAQMLGEVSKFWEENPDPKQTKPAA